MFCDTVIVTKLLGDLPGSSKLQFFLTLKGSLGGDTPLQAMAAGRVAKVKDVAADFADIPLHVMKVSVTSLKRIGRRASGEPYFGKHAAYRFDDPLEHFGSCYCGLHLSTAIAETVLHDEVSEKGVFRIRQEEIDTRYLVTFAAGSELGMLKPADLTGASLKRLGGDNSLSAEYPYDVTQQ